MTCTAHGHVEAGDDPGCEAWIDVSDDRDGPWPLIEDLDLSRWEGG